MDNGLDGEARSFKEDDDEFADSRVGGTFDPLLPVEQQMGTFMQGVQGSRSSAIARMCLSANRQSHTQLGLRAVEARCRDSLRLSADATELARKILHAVLEPPASACMVCAVEPRQSPIQVARCGHGVCAQCEDSGKWIAQKKCCQVCSQPMVSRPDRLNVNSTHAAVIYLAAKATPGSTRTVAEVTAGLNLTDRQFSDGLRRVKVAARSNRWLAEVIRPPATELPQLKELLSRRLASLQVNWGMQCAALAALERMGGFVAGHKGVTVVSAVVMLTLEHLCDDAETAVQRTLQVSPGTKATIQAVAKKLRSDKRFELGLFADCTPPRAGARSTPTVSEQLSLSSWLTGGTGGTDAVASKAVDKALPLPGLASSVCPGANSKPKRKRDSPLSCDIGGEDLSLPLAPLSVTDNEAAENLLPVGWERFLDAASQQYYYHHAVSGTTQWSRPARQCAKRSRR